MNKLIGSVLALAIATLAGCGNLEIRSPIVAKPSPQSVVQKTSPAARTVAQAVTSTPASALVVAPEAFDPGVLSAEQKAQNLKKCQGWEKLSAAEKKKKDFFCWQHVGADPYQGKVETALAQSNWPAEVQQLFLNQIRQGSKAEMILERGMTFDWSTFGKGVSKAFVHHNVVAGWKEGEVHSASVFTVSYGGRIYKLYLPRDCGNWSGNVYSVPTPSPPAANPPAASKPAPVFTTGKCPSGYTLIANAWSLQTLPDGLRQEAEKLMQSANERDSQEATRLDAYKPDDFSRTMGGRLRSEVKVRAPVSADLQVRYLDPQTGKVVRELGVMHVVRGVGSFRFSDDPRAYIVESIWPPDFVSPAMSGGERRLRLFGREWLDFCAMNKHGALLP